MSKDGPLMPLPDEPPLEQMKLLEQQRGELRKVLEIPPEILRDKIDAAFADARECPEGSWIEVPLALWTPHEIEDLYRRLPNDLRIVTDGAMGAKLVRHASPAPVDIDEAQASAEQIAEETYNAMRSRYGEHAFAPWAQVRQDYKDRFISMVRSFRGDFEARR